jgi:hypothetical protein
MRREWAREGVSLMGVPGMVLWSTPETTETALPMVGTYGFGRMTVSFLGSPGGMRRMWACGNSLLICGGCKKSVR